MKHLTIRGKGLALGLITVAVPFAGATQANAAIGGAPPSMFDTRPTLIAVNITDSDSASFCFDKALDNDSISDTGFGFDGYIADEILRGGDLGRMAGAPGGEGFDFQSTTADRDDANTRCVDVDFAQVDGDNLTLEDFTVARVAGGAVQSNNLENREDSSANLDTTSRAGTAGFTDGPVLQRVVVNTGDDNIDFVFDKVVDINVGDDGGAPNADNFIFYNEDGDRIRGATVVEETDDDDGKTVEVTFAGEGAELAMGEVRTAGVQRDEDDEDGADEGAVQSEANGTPAPQIILDVAGQSGGTEDPELESGQLVLGTDDEDAEVVLNFDEDIDSQSIDDEDVDAGVELSNGDRVEATSARGDNGNVILEFNESDMSSIQDVAERVVLAYVEEDAFTDEDQEDGNDFGHAALGGNAGALGTGFTTAPDALRVTFRTGGMVEVLVDQRVGDVEDGGDTFELLNDNGDDVSDDNGFEVQDVVQSDDSPSQALVRLRFDADDLDAARDGGALSIADGAFETIDGTDDEGEPEGEINQVPDNANTQVSITQVLAPR